MNNEQNDINSQINISIVRLVMVAIGIVGIGTVFYHIVEKLKYLDSLYFSVITLTTIGYGDIVPKTNAGKIFTIFYVLIGISILAGIANFIVKRAVVKRMEERNKHRH